MGQTHDWKEMVNYKTGNPKKITPINFGHAVQNENLLVVALHINVEVNSLPSKFQGCLGEMKAQVTIIHLQDEAKPCSNLP